ncbi:rhodanese-like domain-containing protein [Clostridium botulinum]|uniref:rhodanese-like domain-containing protein n=1 Tax=Clostridium botulinum TaxID=1491 RepID=UPI001788CEC9|nr:rhodanese-like domain-containing protein [Clostridium botulinum]MBE1305507.1 rhodanese-like domain-containing protein [Clostridium botulinum]
MNSRIREKFLFYSLFVVLLTSILLIPIYSAKAYKNISPEEIKHIISTPYSTAIIIDVRTPKEFSNGHIPKSLNIPLDKFKDTMLSKNIDKNTKIIIYSNTSVRAKNTSNLLNSLGFNNVYVLDHLNSWSYPLEY